MKTTAVILLLAIAALTPACVSRTSTVEKGYGDDVTSTKLIWIWQKEFRNAK